MITLIINTFSYLWTAPAIDAIGTLVDDGYDAFEVPVSSPHCWPDDMTPSETAAQGRQLSDLGARVRSLNAGGYDINLASPGASMRRKSIEHIRSVMDLAEAWNVRDVVISPGTRRPMISPPLDDVHGWMHDSIEALLPMAEQTGTRLLFENTPYCFAPTIDDLVGLVTTISDDSLRIVYDVANAAYIGEDPIASLLTHHESIALMHISDTGTDTWGHDPIGTGVIDWRSLGQAVDATIGVDNVVLEIIRPEKTLHEFSTAMNDLRAEGWTVPARPVL